jgi:hypothetical protein
MAMLTIDNVLMGFASVLLLFVNWLAFHDFAEAHTVRDWLMLVASVLVIVQFLRVFNRRSVKQGSQSLPS